MARSGSPLIQCDTLSHISSEQESRMPASNFARTRAQFFGMTLLNGSRRISAPFIAILCSWLLICPIALAQQTVQPFVIGDVRTIHSHVLNEDRTFFIYNPDVSAANRLPAYPVLYLLDENDMAMVTGMVSYLSAYNEQMPAMIVVGIPGGATTIRDRTPNHSTIDNFGNIDESPDSWLESSGGGEKFLQFMQDELMPKIEQEYKAAPFKILAGHSVGGLSSIYCLFAHPDMFDAYIAASPSLWWDKGYAISYAKEHAQWPTNARNKFLFVADCPELGPFNRYVDSFNDWLDKNKPARLHYRYLHYAAETHGSTAVKAYYDGLRFIYPNWNIAPTDTSATLIKQHYKELSERLGYRVEPPLGMVDDWALRFLNDPAKINDAIELYRLNAKNFPDSPDAYEHLGDAYVQKGDVQDAAASYRKALRLQPGNTQVRDKLERLP
jgi:predicted alpha/beta superfamily hydrolase